jgi:hypothetical protein
MEKIFEQGLLYDFYGELLTEHQRSIYEDAVYNDMSLGEIAGERGISRQGVHDLIKRCDKILQDYEAKLHLVERFARAKGKIQEIERLTEPGESGDAPSGECMQHIRELAEQLLEEL